MFQNSLAVSHSLSHHDNAAARLWLIDEDDVTNANVLAQFPSLLSAQEKAKWTSIRSEKKQRQFLIGRSALRIILSHYLDNTRPEALQIAAGRHGKPELIDTPCNLQFNLSHSKNKILIGVARNRKIGVDIEYMHADRNWKRIAEDYFHPKEWHDNAEDLKSGVQKFYKLWTLKEALLKAEGCGMQIPLNAFYFDCNSSANPILNSDAKHSVTAFASLWHFQHQYLDNDYSMAVSLQRFEGETHTPLPVSKIVPRLNMRSL